MQWPGDEDEKVVARLELQLLVSFTPVARHVTVPATAAAEGSPPKSNEAAERRASQQFASTSGRAHDRAPLRPASAPAGADLRTAAVLNGGGHGLNKLEGTALELSDLNLEPWAAVGTQPAPGARHPSPAQVSFCAQPFSLDDPALQPHSHRYTVSAGASLSHRCAPPQPACIAVDRLPPAAAASAQQEAARQLGLVTGIPVVPLTVLQPVLERVAGDARQPDLAAATPLARLIQQAERLREAMAQATNPGPTQGYGMEPLTGPVLPSQPHPTSAPADAATPAQSTGQAAELSTTVPLPAGHQVPEGPPTARQRAVRTRPAAGKLPLGKQQRERLDALKRAPLAAPGVAFGRGVGQIRQRQVATTGGSGLAGPMQEQVEKSRSSGGAAPEQEKAGSDGGMDGLLEKAAAEVAVRQPVPSGTRLPAQARAAEPSSRQELEGIGGDAAAHSPVGGGTTPSSSAASGSSSSHRGAALAQAGAGAVSCTGVSVSEGLPAASGDEAAVRHTFEVTLDRVSGLAAGGGAASAHPAACYATYHFPGSAISSLH